MAAIWRWQVLALMGVLVPGGADADEVHPHPDLVRTYYDYGVVEYCGLVDMPVHNGFALLRNDQMARGNIRREDDRLARIAAITAVEYEYQDRGLSGNKSWCRTEGAAAVERFTVYFRTRHLP